MTMRKGHTWQLVWAGWEAQRASFESPFWPNFHLRKGEKAPFMALGAVWELRSRKKGSTCALPLPLQRYNKNDVFANRRWIFLTYFLFVPPSGGICFPFFPPSLYESKMSDMQHASPFVLLFFLPLFPYQELSYCLFRAGLFASCWCFFGCISALKGYILL